MPVTHGPALRALREPDYRRLWIASVLVAFSTWMTLAKSTRHTWLEPSMDRL